MTGRDVPEYPPTAFMETPETLMQVNNLNKEGSFRNVSFDIRKGKFSVLQACWEWPDLTSKSTFWLGHPRQWSNPLKWPPIPLGDPIAAASNQIGYVPEDRLTEGLFLTQSIIRNVAIGRLEHHEQHGFLDLLALVSDANKWLERFKVKTPSVEAPVQSLSGGNQQRVVLARWLARSPLVLILNGPSVGVDVGSKSDIHDIIRDLASSGLGVVVISDDLPELLTTCHRILVMRGERDD